jgi:haloalkane dehalogenase
MEHQPLTLPDGTLARYGHERPRVVYVHGTPSWSHEFREVAEGLSSWASIDHLGFGRSDKPVDGDYSLLAHQRRFADAMEHVQPEGAVFVLHDVGTAIALPWMLAHPDRVHAVVLSNTFLWTADGVGGLVARMYATALGRWFYRRFQVSAGVLLPYAWGRRRPLTAERHAPYLQPFAEVDDRHATAAWPAELVGDTLAAMEPLAQQLSQWPVRAVWGLADPLVGADALARWCALLPDLPVQRLDDVGHFVCEEAPDAVLEVVRQSLR